MKQEKADCLVFATNLDKLKPRESFVAHKLLCKATLMQKEAAVNDFIVFWCICTLLHMGTSVMNFSKLIKTDRHECYIF